MLARALRQQPPEYTSAGPPGEGRRPRPSGLEAGSTAAITRRTAGQRSQQGLVCSECVHVWVCICTHSHTHVQGIPDRLNIHTPPRATSGRGQLLSKSCWDFFPFFVCFVLFVRIFYFQSDT